MTLPLKLSRSLPKPMVRTIPNNGRSLKTVAPTSPFHANDPKSIVQAIPINREPVKSLPAQFQSIIGSLRARLFGQFQLTI